MYIINKHIDKKNALLIQDRSLFYTKDLAKLWQITNANTLNTTISRYIKNGTLMPIYKGLYSTKPLEQIDPILLGAVALHNYAYLSTEWVLAKNGIIFQMVNSYTYCSTKTRNIVIGENIYKSRQLQDLHLYNNTGIVSYNGYKVATTERAIADLLYFNPKYFFDADNIVDWDKVKNIQKEVGYDITPK